MQQDNNQNNETIITSTGINDKVIREISRIKNEPDWMLEKRLKSLDIFLRKPMPTWGIDLMDLDIMNLTLYQPNKVGKYKTWNDVPPEEKEIFEKIGVPQAEREYLAGVVNVIDNEPFYSSLKEEYSKLGIIFCSMDEAVQKYPELVKPYFMTKCVPASDNKFSALHGAVWSGGSFLYVPEGIKVDLPVQTYFKMEGASEGTFEHTLIIAEADSAVQYIEGCSSPVHSLNSLHSAVVEIFVKENASVRYSSIQNWSKDVYNLNTKRGRVEKNGNLEWISASVGSKRVMLYPCSFLIGEGAKAEHLSVGVASGDVIKDTGAKVYHLAPRTKSTILSKSISAHGGTMGYRGLVHMGKNSEGSTSHVQCDGLMMDEKSRSDTWPDIQIKNPNVSVAHEAVVGTVSDEQIFYLRSRGLSENEAINLIVRGFSEDVIKNLPMEYAVEMNNLINMEMEGSVG